MGTTATESMSVELDVVQLSSEDCEGPDKNVSRHTECLATQCVSPRSEGR